MADGVITDAASDAEVTTRSVPPRGAPDGDVVGVLPAAGTAERLQPLNGSKELLPVYGRPVIDYVTERMHRAGCHEIRVVTRSEKQDVIEHATRRGLRVVIGSPGSVADSIALGAQGLRDETTVLIGFPDTLWEPVDGFVRLLAELGASSSVDAVLGLFGTEELERSDVVLIDEERRVRSIQTKPRRPQASVIWGCAAVRSRALHGLRDVEEPSEHFERLARRGSVIGVYLSDDWIDIGTPDALARVDAREPVA